MELYSLKKEKQWWMGTQHVINIDTEVSRLKNTFPISNKWLILPFAITVVSVIIILLNDSHEMAYWTLAITSIVTFLLFALIYFIYNKSRTVVYSDDTEVNITLNRMYKREWTRCFVIIAILQSVYFFALSFISIMDNVESVEIIITFISFAYCLALIPVIFYAYNKMRDARNKMRNLMNEKVYEDDDLYWALGAMFYNNPNDAQTLVEKRIGAGMTVNVATIGGKVVIGFLILMLAVLTGVTLYYALQEFVSIGIF